MSSDVDPDSDPELTPDGDLADSELAGQESADQELAGQELANEVDAAFQSEISVESLLDDLDRVTQERDGYLDDLQRVTAEFANFRRQTDKRQAELRERAAAGLAEALLPVLDGCDAAKLQGIDGVEPIHAQLLAVLEKEGLIPVNAVDDPFDPTRHEAVVHEPADDNEAGTVVAEILRTGYEWNGRVLRPAMVKVRG